MTAWIRCKRRLVLSCTFPASWPQAASMSSPRVLRTVATKPASCNTCWKATIRARGLVENSVCGNGLNGIRLNLHGTSRTSAASCRACLGADGVDAVGEQDAVGVPERADDLAHRKVAVESLLAGRAERAVERATGLRRYAKRSPIVFGDIHGFDRIRAADIEEPLARAVARYSVAHDCRHANLRIAGECITRHPGEIGHRVDAVRETAVDPAQRLPRAERLLAAFGEERSERRRIEVEKIDHVRKSETTSKARTRGLARECIFRCLASTRRRFCVTGCGSPAAERRIRSPSLPSPDRPSRGLRWRRYSGRSRRGSYPAPRSSDPSRPSGRGSSRWRHRLRAP